jgi:hypothetical protein
MGEMEKNAAIAVLVRRILSVYGDRFMGAKEAGHWRSTVEITKRDTKPTTAF